MSIGIGLPSGQCYKHYFSKKKKKNSKSVRNHFTIKYMIKNGKKKKKKKKHIKDLYSPFQTTLRIEMVSTDLFILFSFFFFTKLYHLLDCKMVSDQF